MDRLGCFIDTLPLASDEVRNLKQRELNGPSLVVLQLNLGGSGVLLANDVLRAMLHGLRRGRNTQMSFRFPFFLIFSKRAGIHADALTPPSSPVLQHSMHLPHLNGRNGYTFVFSPRYLGRPV